jgi:hypothetical protein
MYDPTIEQAKFQSWADNFIVLAQNERSLLSQTKAVKDFSFTGARHNFVRSGETEIAQVSGRNPLTVRDEFLFDNRQAIKIPFSKSFIFDQKDMREMLGDPASEVYRALLYAFNRAKDRFIADCALAPVQTGDPNSGQPLATLTAYQDGVKVMDATGGLNYSVITEAVEYFINNSVAYGDMANNNITFAGAGSEWNQLMNEEKFINNNYSKADLVDKGYVNKIFGMNYITFPGSRTGTKEVEQPILKEENTVRKCLLLAEDSIRFTADNVRFKYTEDLQNYVRSDELKFYCEMSAIRTQGAKVLEIDTTF